jgi:hypothetical protein
VSAYLLSGHDTPKRYSQTQDGFAERLQYNIKQRYFLLSSIILRSSRRKQDEKALQQMWTDPSTLRGKN